MIASKTSRRRLQEDEEDSLLAGVDFQTHYLGYKEVFLDGFDLDRVVQEIYSQYLTNEDVKNSTVVAITVAAHQLEFFNVTKRDIEFYIQTHDIKSIHYGGGSRFRKFPNAVVLVTSVPGAVSKLHVMHCFDQRNARKIYEAISRAFDYHAPRDERLVTDQADTAATIKAGKTNKIQPKEKEVNESKNKDKGSKQTASDSSLFRNGSSKGYSKPSFVPLGNFDHVHCDSNLTKSESAPDVTTTTRNTKSRTKYTSTQTKGVEALGLLDNADPDEGFDDEFTKLARSRSASESFKLFGRG